MSSEQVTTVILIAFGLAMDCFAVSISRGLCTKKKRTRTAILIALSFGIFQALMPIIGWYAGETFIKVIEGFDHWVAFALLAAIGLKMILETRKQECEKEEKDLTLPILLTLSVATSIDALAAGLSIAFLGIPVYLSAAIIGAASLSLSLAGFYLGKKAGIGLGGRMEILGGLVLIGIGLKILIEHLS
jgi:manganese efflux pump family protein